MSLETIVRVVCDNCGDRRTTNTHDRNTAEHLISKFGWIIHRWDMYGNVGHFCSDACLKLGIEKYERACNG